MVLRCVEHVKASDSNGMQQDECETVSHLGEQEDSCTEKQRKSDRCDMVPQLQNVRPKRQ